MKNRVTVKILDNTYSILADEEQEYVLTLATEVDKRMRDILQFNPQASAIGAAVLASFGYCDECKKNTKITDNLRSQIKGYAEDTTKYRREAEDLRRQVIRLQDEIATLKKQLDRASTNAKR